jgi:hypothetical protein
MFKKVEQVRAYGEFTHKGVTYRFLESGMEISSSDLKQKGSPSVVSAYEDLHKQALDDLSPKKQQKKEKVVKKKKTLAPESIKFHKDFKEEKKMLKGDWKNSPMPLAGIAMLMAEAVGDAVTNGRSSTRAIVKSTTPAVSVMHKVGNTNFYSAQDAHRVVQGYEVRWEKTSTKLSERMVAQRSSTGDAQHAPQ